MLTDADGLVRYEYEGAFRYRHFCESVWRRISSLVRMPDESEIDPAYASVYEGVDEDDMRIAVLDMLDRMDIARLDGESGFVLFDTFGYVDMLCEVGADGRSYSTASFPVGGALLVTPSA